MISKEKRMTVVVLPIVLTILTAMLPTLKASLPRSAIVVFDESHSPGGPYGQSYTVAGGYSEFRNFLALRGYETRVMTTFSENALADADVVIITIPWDKYTTSQLTTLQDYVAKGGGLLLMGDTFSDAVGTVGKNEYIAGEFGATLFDDMLVDSNDYVGTYQSWIHFDKGNMVEHSITADVANVEYYNGSGIVSVPSGSSSIIVMDYDNSSYWYDSNTSASLVPAMIAFDCQSGRVVVIGDGTLWTSDSDLDGDGLVNFYDADNKILALNTIRWLAENRPPTVTLIAPTGAETWNGTQNIVWTANDPDGDRLSYSICYSNDAGASWIKLTEVMGATSYSWNTPYVSDGTQYMVKVIAFDGYSSAEVQSQSVFGISNPTIWHFPVPSIYELVGLLMGTFALTLVVVLIVLARKQ